MKGVVPALSLGLLFLLAGCCCCTLPSWLSGSGSPPGSALPGDLPTPGGFVQATPAGQEFPATGLREGSTAPDFALPDLAGNTVKLSDFRGRPVLLNLWSTWCGPCVDELPELEAAQKELAATGLAVLGVAVADDTREIRSLAAERGLTYVVLIDDGTVERIYEVEGIPTSYFITPEGVIFETIIGNTDRAEIEQIVQAMEGR